MVSKAYKRSTSLWHMLQMQCMMQRCKHDMMQHAYVHQPFQPKLKKEKQLQDLLANKQMYLGPKAWLGYRQAAFL
jgi:hypothetical protein